MKIITSIQEYVDARKKLESFKHPISVEKIQEFAELADAVINYLDACTVFTEEHEF